MLASHVSIVMMSSIGTLVVTVPADTIATQPSSLASTASARQWSAMEAVGLAITTGGTPMAHRAELSAPAPARKALAHA